MRVNQEHADELWFLKICDTREDASYWEAFFAAEYGLPTAVFHGVGRSLVDGDERIERLFDMLDTESRAKWLMEDLDLHREFPHMRPTAGSPQTLTPRCSEGSAGDGGRSTHHRVQWCSNRPEIAERLIGGGLPVRPSTRESCGSRRSRKDYVEALEVATRACECWRT